MQSTKELERIVREECAKHGGPTEVCQRIYHMPHTSRGGLSKRRYWSAVQEGTNIHAWRNRRGNVRAKQN